MRHKVTVTALAMVMAVANGAAAANTPEARCQSAKNLAAGEYAACRHQAEKQLALQNDSGRYDAAMRTCEARFARAWEVADGVTALAGRTCLDAPLGAADFKTAIDAHTDNIATALGGGGLTTGGGDLATCLSSLASCTAGAATCSGDLNACQGELGDCHANYTSCAGSLTACGNDLGECGNDYTSCSSSLSACQSDLETCAAGRTQAESELATCAAARAACEAELDDCGGGSGGSPPLKTGQTNCSDGSGFPIACAGSGQDGATQAGAARSYVVDAVNGTITDATTGLVWETLDDNNANAIHDKDRTFTWEQALKKVRVLNGDATACIAAHNPAACCTGAGSGSCSPFAGNTDWRLPNSFELLTLVDHGRVMPAIDPAFHAACLPGCTTATCRCTEGNAYWSSTSYEAFPMYAWFVSFGDGLLFADFKDATYHVRAVRSGS